MYRGIYTAPPNAGEGLQLMYIPDRQMIRMEGWHSGRQGTIQAVEMPLGEFLSGLGITAADCQQAMGNLQPQMTMSGQPTAGQQVRRAASEAVPPPTPVPSQAPPVRNP